MAQIYTFKTIYLKQICIWQQKKCLLEWWLCSFIVLSILIYFLRFEIFCIFSLTYNTGLWFFYCISIEKREARTPCFIRKNRMFWELQNQHIDIYSMHEKLIFNLLRYLRTHNYIKLSKTKQVCFPRESFSVLLILQGVNMPIMSTKKTFYMRFSLKPWQVCK